MRWLLLGLRSVPKLLRASLWPINAMLLVGLVDAASFALRRDMAR